MKPLNNNVLLKIAKSNAKVQLLGGHELFVPWGNEDAKHSDVVCEVVAVPDKLRYAKRGTTLSGQGIPDGNTMDWKTTMELRVGDIVIIEYTEYLNKVKEGNGVMEIDGQTHFFCDYSYIRVAKRKWTQTEIDVFWKQYEQSTTKYITQEWMNQNSLVIEGKDIYNVIMLNGFVLVQPVEKELKSEWLILPESLTKTNKKLVRCCYNGSNNQEYMNGVYADADFEPNDYLVIDRDCDVPLEYDTHKSFNGKESYWVVQKCNVHAIVPNYKGELV